MDTLDRLEKKVQALVARTHELGVARQQALDLALKSERECSALKEEIRMLAVPSTRSSGCGRKPWAE